MIASCAAEGPKVGSFRAEARRAEVEEFIKTQISRLAFGSLEMTAYNLSNRAVDSLCSLWPMLTRGPTAPSRSRLVPFVLWCCCVFCGGDLYSLINRFLAGAAC